MKTITPSQIKGDERKWYIIDAQEQTLGRLATKIAVILNFNVDDRGILFVAISFFPLYLMCIFSVYKVLLKKSQEDQ